MLNKIIVGCIIVAGLVGSVLVNIRADDNLEAEQRRRQDQWVDSVMSVLTPDERIGQLIMASAYSNRDEKHVQELEQQVKQYGLGGLIFFQGGPKRQAVMCNRLQAASKVPMLIAMDAEWGLSMRLDSTWSFPRQMALGAQQTSKGTYEVGTEMARQAVRLGVHISFSPDIDVNSNPNNPVIGFRSFGEDADLVTQRGLALMAGLQDHGVIANAKHFPGHGDAAADSHLELPIINRSRKQLDSVELVPFKALFKAGVKSVMVAHLFIPALDTTRRRATSLSPNTVTKLLRKELNFKGLIFTDGLAMKGVTSHYKPGQLEVAALVAGNDVLLGPENVPAVVEAVKQAILTGVLDQDDLDKRVRKVLEAKYWAGLNRYAPINLDRLDAELNPPALKQLNRRLYAKSATVVNATTNYLPIKSLESKKLISIAIQAEPKGDYQTLMARYAPIKSFSVPEKAKNSLWDTLRSQLRRESLLLGPDGKPGTVILSYHNLISKAKNYNLPDSGIALVPKLKAMGYDVVIVAFGNAYSLRNFGNAEAYVMMYEDNAYTRALAPQIVFGSLDAEGRLPVTPRPGLPRGAGNITPQIARLQYDDPESVGMNAQVLTKIDTLAAQVIKDRMAPGCQILVARQGKVVFYKSYGRHTYDTTDRAVSEQTVYDLASVSKVVGTLQAVMQLVGNGLISLDQPISNYLPELMGTNKEDILLQELLEHRAGLQPFIPFWKRTMINKQLSFKWYCDRPEEGFTQEVTPHIYTQPSTTDSVWAWILRSDRLPTNKDGKYDTKYSDFSFLLLQRIVERITHQPLNVYLTNKLFAKLGTRLTYNPLNTMAPGLIAPTELDSTWRRGLVLGTVHDQTAALLGGVAGHAGLFGNANDLAVLLQMNLQDGYYGGQRYLPPGVVAQFGRRVDGTTRGLGWDKPPLEKREKAPISQYASPETYGHTGFTGNCVWVDPVYDLVFVFLSNRVYPDATNNKLTKNQMRGRIHDVVYESLRVNFPNTQEASIVAP